MKTGLRFYHAFWKQLRIEEERGKRKEIDHMRVAVIEDRLKDYVVNVFSQHSDLEVELAAFLEWRPKQEQHNGIEIRGIEELYAGQYDVVLIAIKENRYLSRLLTYLHKKHIGNVYIVRLFTLDMQEDFLTGTQPSIFDSTRVDCMPPENEKPYLVHLETHVCDHCNLNCKACNNFSPFVEKPAYTDISQFEKDVRRLSELFSGIGRFFLLGGEPLLAPELCYKMIRCYRKYFPKNELRVLTNATLILSMKDEFWNCVRENDAIIHISLYPPVRERIDEIRQRLEDKDIRYLVFKKVETFAKKLTLYPFEDAEYNNEICGSAGCHYLREGKISKCPDAILIAFMTEKNSELSSLKSYDNVNIESEADAWDLIEKIDNPIDLCKNCTYIRLERIKWERVAGKAQPADWLLPHRYEAEVTKLKCENENANREIDGLKRENENANEEIDKLKHGNENANREIDKLKRENENTNRKIKILEHEIEQTNDKVRNKDNEIASIKKKLSEYESREKDLSKKYDDIEDLLEKAQSEYDRINNSYSNKIGRLVTWLPRNIRRLVKKILERSKC